MNYIQHNDFVDIPHDFFILPIDPYEQGMYDFWYRETKQQHNFNEDALKLYNAGCRNAELILLTLRSKS